MNNISVKVWIEHVKKNIDALEASINLADKNKFIVKNYLEEHKRTPQLVIYFTDGYIPQPTFINRAQRLFIITKDGQTHVVEPFGKTVRLLD